MKTFTCHTGLAKTGILSFSILLTGLLFPDFLSAQCSGLGTITLSLVDLPTPTLAFNPVVCPNRTTNITVNENFSSYAWSNGDSGPAITVGVAGQYTVTVSNSAGCTGTAVAAIALPAGVFLIPTITPYACNGQRILNAGGAYPTYSWSNNASGSSIAVTSSGAYTVTATNAQGCTGTATFSVTIPPAPNVQISGNLSLCANDSTTLSASPGFASYSWSGGSTADSIVVPAGGAYTVTATDANGCTDTAAVTVTALTSPAPSIAAPNPLCQGQTIMLTVGNGPYNAYAWTSGDTTANMSASTTGQYGVTVTDANGCTGTTAVALIVHPNPVPGVAAPTALCQGQTAMISVNNGPFNAYAWTSGDTTANISASIAGTYGVTVTDGNGCTGSTSVALAVNTNPVPVITLASYACDGIQNLLATAGFAQYAWSNANSTANTQVNAPGTYSVTVTDGAGCTGVASQQVTIPAAPVVQVTGPAAICSGATAILTATAGFVQYAWSTAQTGATIGVGMAGTYSVTATDANGCTAAAQSALSVSPMPQPVINGPINICPAETATFNLSTPFASYLWSTNTTGPNITTALPGAYTVTVTDAAGCTGTASTMLQVSNNLSPAITAKPYQCDNQITLDAGVGYQNYSWSNGSNTGTVIALQPGVYTVTVSNASGCSGTASFNVQIPAVPVIIISGISAVCTGTSATLSATAGFTTYAWSNGGLTQAITVSGGSYQVTATDGNGCTAVNSFNLSTNPLPTPAITGSTTICNGESSVLNASTGFIQYQWSAGENMASTSVNTAGAYTVTVTDAAGCTGTASTSLTMSNNLSPAIAALPYQCDKKITLDAGLGYQNYNWSNGGNTAMVNLMLAGVYTVTVSNTSGCTGTASFNVQIPALPAVTVTGPSAICAGATTMLTATAGFAGYSWSGGGLAATTTAAQAGSYTVTVTDANGCTATGSFTLAQDPVPNPGISGGTTICAGATVNLNASGGFVNYVWSTNATTAAIGVNTAGAYTVTVTDSAGCTGTASTTLTTSPGLAPAITELPYQCDGQIALDAGAGYQNYAWSNGNNTATGNALQTGVYTVTVSNGNGCTGTASAEITIPAAPSVNISGPVTLCAGDSATLSIDHAASFASVSWSTAATGASIVVGTAGPVSVTVTDAYGCPASATATVTIHSLLVPAIDKAAYQCDNQLVLTVNEVFASYTWSNNESTPSISVTNDGDYSITVTDANGCSGTASIYANVPDDLFVVVQSPPTPICPGDSAILSVTPGLAGYLWNTGELTNKIIVHQSGTYSVIATDQNGCTATDDYVFILAEAPAIIIQGNPVIDCEHASANVTAKLSAGGNGASFVWSNGTTTATITSATAGNFRVTVTNGLGCTNTASVAITEKPVTTFFADSIEFKTGQMIPLQPPIGFAASLITWTPVDILSCDHCPDPKARPVENIVVSYVASAVGPCVAEGFYYLFRRDDPWIYAPTAFDPGSNLNYAFTIYGNDQVLKINYLRIYDRWGDLVRNLVDIAPGDLNAGWDGKFNGQLVMPGVYVYAAEVLLSDGSTRLLSGDVTVTR